MCFFFLETFIFIHGVPRGLIDRKRDREGMVRKKHRLSIRLRSKKPKIKCFSGAFFPDYFC